MIQANLKQKEESRQEVYPNSKSKVMQRRLQNQNEK